MFVQQLGDKEVMTSIVESIQCWSLHQRLHDKFQSESRRPNLKNETPIKKCTRDRAGAHVQGTMPQHVTVTGRLNPQTPLHTTSTR